MSSRDQQKSQEPAGEVREKVDGKPARGNAFHSTEGEGEHPTFLTLTNMRVLRLNEDVTIQNAQAAGVDVGISCVCRHSLCLRKQPKYPGKRFCLGRQPLII